MTPAPVDLLGFPFLVEIFASWGAVTLIVSLAIGAWQRLTCQQTGWQASMRNRRAAIVHHYPDAA